MSSPIIENPLGFEDHPQAGHFYKLAIERFRRDGSAALTGFDMLEARRAANMEGEEHISISQVLARFAANKVHDEAGIPRPDREELRLDPTFPVEWDETVTAGDNYGAIVQIHPSR